MDIRTYAAAKQYTDNVTNNVADLIKEATSIKTEINNDGNSIEIKLNQKAAEVQKMIETAAEYSANVTSVAGIIEDVQTDFYSETTNIAINNLQSENQASKSLYIRNNKVSVIDSSNTTLGIVAVTANDTLLITSTVSTSASDTSGFAFTDDDNNLIYHYTDDTLSSLTDKTDIEITVPDGATKLYINRLASKGEPLAKVKTTSVVKTPKIYNNRLTGKTILAFGDSMVQGHSLSDDQTWLYKLAQRNGMTHINKGQNGTTLTRVDTVSGDRTFLASESVYAKVMSNLNDPVQADYIIVFAGTNDIARSVELGSIDDTGSTTFYGALNNICTRLIQTYPKGHIAFFTPYARNAGAANFDTCKKYVSAIEQVCERHSIPVFNNIVNGGIDWTNQYQIAALTLNDTYHLNETGQEYASYKYEAFLNNMQGSISGATPIKGVDYWTDEDKAEIKSYIDSVIGNANSDLETRLNGGAVDG